MNESHQLANNPISLSDWRKIVAAINSALKNERSTIGTRERKRLDRIATAKHGHGMDVRHPTHVLLVEKSQDRLWVEEGEISHASLVDRSLRENFDIEYFTIESLNEEIKDLMLHIQFWSDSHDLDTRVREGSSARNGMSKSEKIVKYLTGIYKRVFKLHPYLGGVGANEHDRSPNSPFGAFATSVLNALDIRTRNGSRYSIGTIKNCMPAGNLRSAMLPVEPELTAARIELEIDSFPSRGPGRRKKAD